jgi:mycobactin salicyl-AMP ligase
MILTPEERLRRNVSDGVWTRVTIDEVFRRGLSAEPDVVVFHDYGPGAQPGAALTFAEAHRRVEAVAAYFAATGLKPDSVLGIHLPPSAHAATVMLAGLRAGLILCPLALHLTASELAMAAEATSMRAIVTAAEFEGEPLGELVRAATADVPGLRAVFTLGGAGGGSSDLDDLLDDPGHGGPAPRIIRWGSAADHVALLSVARAGDGRPAIVPFSHNHLVAMALAHVLEAGVDGAESVLCTMHPASLAGFAGGLLTALVSGGSIAFHHPASLAGLAAAAIAADAGRIVLPAAVAGELDKLLPPATALSMVSTGVGPLAGRALSGARKGVDLLTLGGLVLLPRAAGERGTLPAGPARFPPGVPAGLCLYQTALKPAPALAGLSGRSAGELLLTGAIIPDAPWPERIGGESGAGPAFMGDGALRTRVLGVPTADGAGLRIVGASMDGARVADSVATPDFSGQGDRSAASAHR